MQKLILIAVAGAAGTLCRYGLAGVVQKMFGSSFAWGTVVIEIVDKGERIGELLPELDAMIQEGLVTLENVRVIAYRHS